MWIRCLFTHPADMAQHDQYSPGLLLNCLPTNSAILRAATFIFTTFNLESVESLRWRLQTAQNPKTFMLQWCKLLTLEKLKLVDVWCFLVTDLQQLIIIIIKFGGDLLSFDWLQFQTAKRCDAKILREANDAIWVTKLWTHRHEHLRLYHRLWGPSRINVLKSS